MTDHQRVLDERLATMTERERLDSLEKLLGYVTVWRVALLRQNERVLSGGQGNSPDVWLWATALVGLLRQAELAERLRVPVKQLLDAFATAAPDARDVRDVLEHLEDYELGIGRRQSPGQGSVEFLYCFDGMWTLELQGVGRDGRLRLEFATAHPAAEALGEGLLKAVHDLVEDLRQVVPPRVMPPRPDLDFIREREAEWLRAHETDPPP